MSSSVITQQVQGLATDTSPGLVGTGAQTFGGTKTFQDATTFKSTAGTVTAGSYDSSGGWTLGSSTGLQNHTLWGNLAFKSVAGTGGKLWHNSISITNSSTYTLFSGAMYGFLLIHASTGGTERFSIFSINAGGNNTTQLVTGGLGISTSSTLNNASTLNCAFSSSNYILQNNSGSTLSVSYLMMQI